jgi:short-subunit dehydrogenase
MNNWALITGASSGIGRELAKVFAENRLNLVLVARNESKLKDLAADLETRHGITANVVPKDLSLPSSAAEIFAAARDHPVSILVNNAGFGWRGPFAKGDLDLALNMMHVNMDALVELTHLFVQPMLARREGRILNLASTAAFQPGPFMNVYYATKAFVLSFSLALAEELAGSGVTVTTLCPGPTRTEFFQRAGMKRAMRGLPELGAEEVARIGYRGLMKGKRIVTPGIMNRVLAAMARRSPLRLTTKIARRLNED